MSNGNGDSEDNNWDLCSSFIPDCPKDQINMGELCFPMGEYTKDCTVFQHFNPLNKDELVKGTVVSSSSVTDEGGLLECLQKGMMEDEIDAVIYNNHARSDESSDSGDCQPNMCYLLNTTDLSAPEEIPTELCQQYIFKKTIPEESSGLDCMNIQSDNHTKLDSPVSLTIDRADGTRPPGNDLMMVTSDYMGSECRKEIVNSTDTIPTDPTGEDYSDMLTGFGDWCNKDKNKYKKVCNEFCNNVKYNSYCAENPPWMIVTSLAIFLVILFISLMLYRKYRNELYLYIGIGLAGLFFIWFGFAIAIYIIMKGTYSGDEADYPISEAENVNVNTSAFAYAPKYVCKGGGDGQSNPDIVYDAPGYTKCSPSPSVCCTIHPTGTELFEDCPVCSSSEYGCCKDSDCSQNGYGASCKKNNENCGECHCKVTKEKVKNKENGGKCLGKCYAYCLNEEMGTYCTYAENECAPGYTNIIDPGSRCNEFHTTAPCSCTCVKDTSTEEKN